MDRKLTDVTMVPPILTAGLRSAIYKNKRSDRTLTGATLEMEILSQGGGSILKDFKPSSINHGKLRQCLNRRACWWIHGDAGLQNFGKRALNCSGRQRCHGKLSGDNDAEHEIKQKAYGTFAFSEMHAERIEQLVSLP